MRIEPFHHRVPDSHLAELRQRIHNARWPEASPVAGWGQGIPVQTVRELCAYWVDGYDWREAERQLDAVGQFRADVDGLGIHFLHARSPEPGAFPLILTHGWPGSVLELAGLAKPLTDAGFDVVIPSLPGYGFSDKPFEPGWGIERIAGTWAKLMAGLGYRRYGAAGSDWGTSISSCLAARHPEQVAGIHLIPPLAGPAPDDVLTDSEQAARDEAHRRGRNESGYSEMHRTAPQTIGYALLDSPTGLCAWMAEKLLSWGDGLTRDQVLDQVTLYWLTGTAASSARLYAESIERVGAWIDGRDVTPVNVPAGASIFARESPRPSRRWAARRYPDIRFWAEHDRGGHFPALEVPELLIGDLCAFFSEIR
ncbi:epoxide hydrolase family protein [Actinoplanes couchii]|uniref:Hydrolase n=1 Tax=Actinoplanes couchii TaxID=403638 RepID=A0ABQ3XHI3_9ACTN|nr:epoxide hydrolase family protein [Actinoplanes couchii]MDR6317573.1 pimeloyl-ACP methyl ester carboxylesterase [Actinoplanes couchii]GID57958.1 hydrolase [Actinoplanes couchii]